MFDISWLARKMPYFSQDGVTISLRWTVIINDDFITNLFRSLKVKGL